MTAEDRLVRRTSRIVKVVPSPPRDVRLDGQRLVWVEPQATGHITHYLIRVGSDASDPKHKVAVGQNSMTMAFGDQGFWISSYNAATDSESQKVYLDGRVQDVVATDDVRRYGAIGDGRDDSQAIIDCLTENASVCFPAGYVFSSNPINAASVPSIRVYGGGTLKLIDSATGSSLLSLSTIPDVHIENVVLDGNQANNGTATAGHILSCSDCAAIRIMDVQIINPRQGPFQSLSPSVVSDIQIQNLTVKNSGYEGVKLDVGATGRVFASGLDISTVTSTQAFHIVNGSKHMIVGARIFNNYGGVAIWTTGTGTLVGCTITGNTTSALSFTLGTFRHVGCILTGNGSVYASSLLAYSVESEGVTDTIPALLLKSANPIFEQRLVDNTLVGLLSGGAIFSEGAAASLEINRDDSTPLLSVDDTNGMLLFDSAGVIAYLQSNSTGTTVRKLFAQDGAEIVGSATLTPLVVKVGSSAMATFATNGETTIDKLLIGASAKMPGVSAAAGLRVTAAGVIEVGPPPDVAQAGVLSGGAHTLTLAKITPGGTDGAIQFNANGQLLTYVDPT